MEIFSDIWNVIFIRPMVNSLILLYIVLGQNFGLSIISFTMIIRLLMFPLSIRQTKQMKAMSVMQPKIKQIQEKFKDDRQKISQETMALYKQQGINPYPARYVRSHNTLECIDLFKKIEKENPDVEHNRTTKISTAGRIMAIRKMGNASFIDIQDGFGKL